MRGNSTSIIFDSGDSLYLFGSPDVGYSFVNFTGESDFSLLNNYSYAVIQNETIWCYFQINSYNVTFLFTSAGEFHVNFTNISNSTQTSYEYGTVLHLEGLPETTYQFTDFSWSGGSSVLNPYDYSVDSENSIWCNFQLGGAGDGSLLGGDDLAGFMILIFILIAFVIIIIWRLRS